MDMTSILLLCTILMRTAKSSMPEVHDFCESEQFYATCKENEVIIIRYAKFGRMRASRCIGGSGTIGQIGCSVDAKSDLDQKCSGRQECDMVVSQLVPANQQQCKLTYRSFLEAAYECVQVAYAQPEICTGPLEVKGSLGFLSSRVAETNGCGTLDSPWFVTVQPGQQLKFSLLDFGSPISRSASRTGPTCHVYAIIKEERQKTGSKTICRTGSRKDEVFTSVGNMVEVRLVIRNKDATDNHFLLEYKAVGCPDIPVPQRGWVQRVGRDEAVVGCNVTGESSHVRCEGNTWKGTWSNCTEERVGLTTGAVKSRWTLFSHYHGVSIFVIVCIAIGVGVVILGFGLLYLRRRRNKQQDRNQLPPPSGMAEEEAYNYRNKSVPVGYNTDTRHSAKVQDPGYCSQSENDYYKTWQMQRHIGTGAPNPHAHIHQHHRHSTHQAKHKHPSVPLPPPPPYSDGSMGYNRNVEHIYESPKFPRRSGIEGDSDDLASPTEYYELDPEEIDRVHA